MRESLTTAADPAHNRAIADLEMAIAEARSTLFLIGDRAGELAEHAGDAADGAGLCRLARSCGDKLSASFQRVFDHGQ